MLSSILVFSVKSPKMGITNRMWAASQGRSGQHSPKSKFENWRQNSPITTIWPDSGGTKSPWTWISRKGRWDDRARPGTCSSIILSEATAVFFFLGSVVFYPAMEWDCCIPDVSASSLFGCSQVTGEAKEVLSAKALPSCCSVLQIGLCVGRRFLQAYVK